MKLKNMWKRFWTLDVHNHEGFTLVELIIVIAILAILSTGAIAGYSAYVEKANAAVDAQLLAEINLAFRSACLDYGFDSYDIPYAKWDDNNGTIETVDHSMGAKIIESFKKFFTAKIEFKSYESIHFDYSLRQWVAGADPYGNLYQNLKDKFGDKFDDLLSTSLGQVGTENLFDKMNGAMDMAFDLKLFSLAGMDFMAAYCNYLGVDINDSDLEEKAAAAIEKLGVDQETAMTNAIALYAAQNTSAVKKEDLGKWLGGNMSTDDLQANSGANTLAEAAAIYGLYLSYCQETNGAVPEGGTLDVMNKAMANQNFAEWVNTNQNAQTELDAYKTYMDLINEAAKDDEARKSVLVNGFADPELEELMKSLLGN